jgi:hypothetical protein
MVTLRFAPERLPPLLPQALPRRGTPLDTGGRLLFIDVFTAFPALYPEFVREHLNLGTAIGASVHGRPQVSHILSRALAGHGHPHRSIIQQYLTTCQAPSAAT